MLCMENREDCEEEGVRIGLESCTGEDRGRDMKAFGDFGWGVLPYGLRARKSNAGCKEKPLLNFVIGHEPAP